MSMPVITSADVRAREGFDDPARGDAFWYTFFSSDITPTAGMSAGVMVIPPNGGRLEPHRHAQAELYFIAAGSGILTIDGVETVIATGAAAFIPGDALHSIRNLADEALQVFYVFPTDKFADIVYRFA
jgi:mannose-6-phosphate isomerase-like protein (cupin superfamily)